ncbi:MAG: succinate dehydrogenase assembly factor 2 [Minwuia sp.]|uniref:succinate dehydrogenase assembly factor 2 n=1 Tax=Minwuia sp. TaxID=2493630 RepID=UPI003A8C48C1
MSDNSEALEVRRRKLMYRSNYTGTKESDIILSRFAERNLPTFSERQMDLYEQILGAGDPEIVKWVVQRKPVPPEFDNEVSRMLVHFKFDPTGQ